MLHASLAILVVLFDLPRNLRWIVPHCHTWGPTFYYIVMAFHVFRYFQINWSIEVVEKETCSCTLDIMNHEYHNVLTRGWHRY